MIVNLFLVTKLSVNINKFATLRNARGGNVPDILKVAKDCELFGADGITVHPRPDERHIRYDDVIGLKDVVTSEYNIEGYPSPEFMKLVGRVLPTQVTLVPDPPDVLTSNAGWEVAKNREFLKSIIQELKDKGIRTSLFVDTNCETIREASMIGVDRVELYTERYASAYAENRKIAVDDYVLAAECAKTNGLELNAGHDLSLNNLAFFRRNIPYLKEVSIGHALVCDALYLGLENAIQLYRKQLLINESFSLIN